MLTGIYAARTVAGDRHEVWDVNVDGDYHEEVRGAGGDRLVPAGVAEPTLDEFLASTFARFDAVALGAAVGATAGLGLFLATVFLLLRHGGEPEGAWTLSLLGIYLSGYAVTWTGALLGLVEGAGLGFLLGAGMAGSINLLMRWVESALERELEEERTLDPLEGSTG